MLNNVIIPRDSTWRQSPSRGNVSMRGMQVKVRCSTSHTHELRTETRVMRGAGGGVAGAVHDGTQNQSVQVPHKDTGNTASYGMC